MWNWNTILQMPFKSRFRQGCTIHHINKRTRFSPKPHRKLTIWRHGIIHTDDKPFSSLTGTRISVSHVVWKKYVRIHNNKIHKHEKWEARDWRSMIDSILKIDIRKLLAEPKWVFLQTMYSRVVFIVTHFAFDKMERIKTTEIYNLLYWILRRFVWPNL